MASETNERNVLAELANELTWVEDILRSEGYGSYCDEANKAKRIIAELSKVETATDLVGLIGKCRAIAE